MYGASVNSQWKTQAVDLQGRLHTVRDNRVQVSMQG
jgi:hypothetical protein